MDLVGVPFLKNNTTVFTPAPTNVPAGISNTISKLQVSIRCLRKETDALSVLDKKVFFMTIPARPVCFKILIKCCKNKNAVSLVLISKFFGKKVIFIESFSRVESPSLFGKLIDPISNLTVVQWKSLLRYYPKGVYGGPIFNFKKNIPSSKKTKGIFVTLGSRKENFDRLLQ